MDSRRFQYPSNGRYKTGVSHHITHVRRPMHRYGLSLKLPRLYHTKKAKKPNVVQYRLKEHISRPKERKFTIFVQDISIFIHDPKSGRKYRTRIGHPPSTVPYKTQKDQCSVQCHTKKGRYFFKQYPKFNGPNFVSYLKESQRKFGKIAVIVDRAPQQRCQETAQKKQKMRLIYLPKGSLELNMVRWYWAGTKRNLLMSEYYHTLENMRMAISEYFRTLRYKITLKKFLYRKILEQVEKTFGYQYKRVYLFFNLISLILLDNCDVENLSLS